MCSSLRDGQAAVCAFPVLAPSHSCQQDLGLQEAGGGLCRGQGLVATQGRPKQQEPSPSRGKHPQ